MSIKGLDTIEAVLLLMKEPEKFEAKLAEIKAATAKYQEVVEAVVALSQVNDYTNSITRREAESKEILEKAKDEAASIKAKTKILTDQKMKELQTREDRVAAREKDCERTEEYQSRAQLDISMTRQSLQDQEAKLVSKEQQLTQALAEVEERKAKLKAALNV